jgi:hypothetical protein
MHGLLGAIGLRGRHVRLDLAEATDVPRRWQGSNPIE